MCLADGSGHTPMSRRRRCNAGLRWRHLGANQEKRSRRRLGCGLSPSRSRENCVSRLQCGISNPRESDWGQTARLHCSQFLPSSCWMGLRKGEKDRGWSRGIGGGGWSMTAIDIDYSRSCGSGCVGTLPRLIGLRDISVRVGFALPVVGPASARPAQ
jgi:hypothetical protein